MEPQNTENPLEGESHPRALSPWLRPDVFPERPAGMEYGYLSGGKMIGCAREELFEKCKKDRIPRIHLVWTPATPRLVPPGEVYYLFEAVRQNSRRRMVKRIGFNIIHLFLWGFLFYLAESLPIDTSQAHSLSWLFLFNLVFLGALPAYRNAQQFVLLRTYTPQNMVSDAFLNRYLTWLRTRKITATWITGACLLSVFLVQCITGMEESIYQAGLVKPEVWKGEVWRLLTYSMIHGGLLHICFNTAGLVTLGWLMEALAHRTYVYTVFVVSALAGSVFSLFLYPNVISVGASGGLMGFVGFLAVLGRRRKSVMPRGFSQSITLMITLIAMMGLAAFAIIDNAAHVGGFLGGVFVGWITISRTGQTIPLKPSAFEILLGNAARALIILTAVITASLLLL